MIRLLKRDLKAILERDPAARNYFEVILCYPGFHAVFLHRIAHKIYGLRLVMLSRMLATFNRFVTNVDIHPACKIGGGFFIDHGAGVVIGETTEIGENVTIYQGVTLGGTGKDSGKRHPIIGNSVIVSAGAKLLGPFKVGDYAKIGAGSVVLKEVPAFSTVVGIPGRIIKVNNIKLSRKTNDSIQEQFEHMMTVITKLEQKIAQLEQGHREIIGTKSKVRISNV